MNLPIFIGLLFGKLGVSTNFCKLSTIKCEFLIVKSNALACFCPSFSGNVCNLEYVVEESVMYELRSLGVRKVMRSWS